MMKLVERIDPVQTGVFVAKPLTEIHVDDGIMIFRGNIGPGVDAFFVHQREGDVSKLGMLVRATGEVYDKVKKALDECGEVPEKV